MIASSFFKNCTWRISILPSKTKHLGKLFCIRMYCGKG
jgi:hypothetical protein